MKIGDSVEYTFYGELREGVITRLGTSTVVFVKDLKTGKETWKYVSSLILKEERESL